MRKTSKFGAGLTLLGAMLTTTAAFGHSNTATKSEVDELRSRIASLEASSASDRPLAFSTGPNTTISLYGFVRAEAFYDFDFELSDFASATAVGNPANATSGAFNTSVRTSRFGIRSTTQTDIGEVGTQVEFDLFGSGGDQTGSPNLRLRHANVTVGNWLIGQSWTNFMPLATYPTTVDFNGPVGIPFARLPQIRYTGSSGGLTYSFSIEEAAGTSSQPAVTAALSYADDNFSVRASALANEVESGGSEFDTYGFTLSGGASLWEGGSFNINGVAGTGIGSYLIGGGAAVVGGQTNDVYGYNVELRQAVTDKLDLGITYGTEVYDLATAVAGGDFTELRTVHANAFYNPTDNLRIGVEYIYLERESAAGVVADGSRLGASVTLSF